MVPTRCCGSQAYLQYQALRRRRYQQGCASRPNNRGEEDDTGSLLASSEGSSLRPPDGVTVLVPPMGGDEFTAFNTMGSRSQCTADDTAFLGGRSAACGAGESRTQYMAGSRTQCTAKSHIQHKVKSTMGSDSRRPLLCPGVCDWYLRRAPGDGTGGRDGHGTGHVLASIGETSLDNLIGEEEEE